METPAHTSTQRLAYLLLRLPVAMTMLMQGAVKVYKLETFRLGMAKLFAQSRLPYPLVNGFAGVLPFLELVCGMLLLLGLFTQVAAGLGWLLMLVYIFGSSMVDSGTNAVFTQLFLAGLFTLLILFQRFNWYSLDRIKKPARYS
jgi:thiosulfate dehydrogenase [quinone] large subunit